MSSSSSSSAAAGFPVGVCLKVSSLRPRYPNLRVWTQQPGHLMVVRQGRVFIDKQIFSYPSSPWANPFKLSEYSLDESLRLFEAHLAAKLKDPETRKQFLKLKDAKEIGCFCDPGNKCHRDVIIRLLRQCVKEEEEAGNTEMKDAPGQGKQLEDEQGSSSAHQKKRKRPLENQ